MSKREDQLSAKEAARSPWQEMRTICSRFSWQKPVQTPSKALSPLRLFQLEHLLTSPLGVDIAKLSPGARSPKKTAVKAF